MKYFNEYKLEKCIITEYCKTSIVEAQNLLIETALLDVDNYKFITLSQACIPFKPFNYIYNLLIENDSVYFNMCSSTDDEIFPRCNDLLNFFEKNKIKKSSNWFILNRELSQDMISHKDLIKYFNNVYCPEEHYFIMICFIVKKDSQIIFNTEIDTLTTFTNWFYNKTYKYARSEYNTIEFRRGLFNYATISEKELIYLLNSKCLFGRKFNKICNVFSRKMKKNIILDEYICNYTEINKC
jgi:hypothetical protein